MVRDGVVAPPSARRAWASMAPTAAFLVVNRVSGVATAAIAATSVAAAVIVGRVLRRDRVGWVLPIALIYVVARGAVSALTGSEDVYFGIGIAVSAAFAVGVLASAWSSRPAALYVVPLVAPYPESVRTSARYLRVARHVSATWALAELSVTAWEAWHLRAVGPVEFVARRTLIGWPFMAFVVFWLIFYVRLRLDPVAHHVREDASSSGSSGSSGPSGQHGAA